MKKATRFIELDLNTDSLVGIDIYAAKKITETGQGLIDTINANNGLTWLTPEKISIQTIKDCAEIIKDRNERGTLGLKLAKAILALIKKPGTRNVVEKRRITKRKR